MVGVIKPIVCTEIATYMLTVNAAKADEATFTWTAASGYDGKSMAQSMVSDEVNVLK